MRATLVDRHARQPCRKARVAAKRLELVQQHEQHILHDVIGFIVAPAEQSSGEPADARLVQGDELFERPLLALPSCSPPPRRPAPHVRLAWDFA
jgi:hypothetical protein